VAQSLNNLAAALQNSGRLDEAEPLYDELLAMHARLDPPDSSAWADALNTRMALAFRKDEIDVALPLARQILDINRALFGDAHPRVAQSMNNVAQLLVRTGEYEEAEPLLRASLAQIREFDRRRAPEHRREVRGTSPACSVASGAAEEAEPLYLEALAMNRRLLGDRHPALAVALNELRRSAPRPRCHPRRRAALPRGARTSIAPRSARRTSTSASSLPASQPRSAATAGSRTVAPRSARRSRRCEARPAARAHPSHRSRERPAASYVTAPGCAARRS
jgi:tetratricopeptide (TPR) repeat protein